MCGKKNLKFENFISILESSLIFLSFKIPHILGYECFLTWLIFLYPLKIFPIKCVFIIWVLLTKHCKIDFCLTLWCSHLKALNQNLNLNFHQICFGMNSLTFIWMKSNNLPWLSLFRIEKHKYWTYFDYFCLGSNPLFGPLNCNYALFIPLMLN
jgi:hypothetical protein